MNVPLFNHFSQNLSKKLAFGHSGDIIEWGLAEGAARARPVVWDATKSQKMINADLLAMPWPICLPRRGVHTTQLSTKVIGMSSIFFLPPRSWAQSSECSGLRPSLTSHDKGFIYWPPRQHMTVQSQICWAFNCDNDHGCPSPLHVTFFWSHPILTVQDFHQWDEKACVAIHRCLLTALQKW